MQWKCRQSSGPASSESLRHAIQAAPLIHVSIHASLEAGDRVAIVGHVNIDHAWALVKNGAWLIYIFFARRRAMTVTGRAAFPSVRAEGKV